MSPRIRLGLAVLLWSVAFSALSAQPLLTAQADSSTGKPSTPNADTTEPPGPEKPRVGSPPVVQPPPGTSAPKRQEQGAGRTPDAPATEDPGVAGRINESAPPTSGAR